MLWKRPASLILACLSLIGLARGQSYISAWGQQVVDSRWNDQAFVQIAAGDRHTMALRSDGTVVAWGWNGYTQCNVPPLPAGLTYVQIAAGGNMSLGLRSNGTAILWGGNGVRLRC